MGRLWVGCGSAVGRLPPSSQHYIHARNYLACSDTGVDYLACSDTTAHLRHGMAWRYRRGVVLVRIDSPSQSSPSPIVSLETDQWHVRPAETRQGPGPVCSSCADSDGHALRGAVRDSDVVLSHPAARQPSRRIVQRIVLAY